MDPQYPYQQPNDPRQTPGSGLPAVQPSVGQPLQPQPQFQSEPQSQPAQQPIHQSYTSEYQQQQFSQPYQQPVNTSQPSVDYGNQPTDQQREQFSIDYLNKIAPKEQKTVNKFAVFGLIGAVLISAIFAVVLMSQSSGPDIKSFIPKLAARVQTLQTVTTNQQPHLTDNSISEANASLSSALDTMDAELQSLMKAGKLKPLSDKSSVASEKSYLDDLNKKLDDAYQKGTADRTYTAQMTYELSILRGQMVKFKKLSNNSQVSTFCDNSIKSLDITLKSLSTSTTSKS